MLGNEGLVYDVAWPQYDPQAIVKDEVEIVVQVNGKLRDKMMVSAAVTEEELEAIVLENEKIKSILQGVTIVKVIKVPKKLVNFVVR